VSTDGKPHPLGFDQKAVTDQIVSRCLDQQGGISPQGLEDIKEMILFAVEIGSDLEWILTRLMDRGNYSGIAEINRLKNKYGLVTEAASPTCVTLDRVCLAFPSAACQYMPLARNPVVDKNALLSMCSDYPQVMMHEAFATLIPNTLNDQCKRIIIDAHCVHQAHYWAIIGRDKYGNKPIDYIGSLY
jgi:Tenuivirus/Phlebovirus nucleocapsid protein